MIPNPSLDCSYVVLNFWPNVSLVLIKLFLYKKKRVNNEIFLDPSPQVEETFAVHKTQIFGSKSACRVFVRETTISKSTHKVYQTY